MEVANKARRIMQTAASRVKDIQRNIPLAAVIIITRIYQLQRCPRSSTRRQIHKFKIEKENVHNHTKSFSNFIPLFHSNSLLFSFIFLYYSAPLQQQLP